MVNYKQKYEPPRDLERLNFQSGQYRRSFRCENVFYIDITKVGRLDGSLLYLERRTYT